MLVLLVPGLGVLGALLANGVHAEESKSLVTLQVRLLHDGTPLDADLDLTFKVYDVDSGGSPLWTESQVAVPVRNGILAAQLGINAPLGSVFRSGLGMSTDRWVAIEQGGVEIVPRVQLTAVPYAQGASAAEIASTIWNQATGTALAITDIPDAIYGEGLEHDGAGHLRLAATAAGSGLTGGGGTALQVSPIALVNSGSAAILADRLEIAFVPSHYSPRSYGTLAESSDELTAHLAGIDDALGTSGSGTSGGSNPNLARCMAGGRLTVSGTDPAPVADVTSSSLHYLPYCHDQISLYVVGSATWQLHTLSATGVSIDNTGLSADSNYDVFLFDSAGTLSLELVAWSTHGAGTSARSVDLQRQDGVHVKQGSPQKRYLGTVRTNASTQFTDKEGQRFCWNVVNRVLKGSKTQDASSWTDNTSTYKLWNSSLTYRHEFVVGLLEDVVSATAQVTTNVPGGGTYIVLGFGLDSSSVAADSANAFENSGVNETPIHFLGPLGTTNAGYHYLQALESVVSGGTTAFGGSAAMSSASRS